MRLAFALALLLAACDRRPAPAPGADAAAAAAERKAVSDVDGARRDAAKQSAEQKAGQPG